ncbi:MULTISPECIES: heat shock protein transcriptional repressor HspR [unclassified Adlercreutzia]|uniref:heat shock protein transcriptional repressor HspR n=1 Tax=unclassified Adlercreutzia TaxID=2636013 RepID=UPI0013EB7EA0|nr:MULTISPECIES: helix-turn-helix transcriptional regulator [unclassified Adlercreutzia]
MVGPEDRNRPLYMIGVAAELAGVHPQTLRTYEQKGLLSPQRTSGNTRMYSQADIERLELINELTAEGINLAGVTRILDLQTRLDECEYELDNLHKRVQRLARRVNELSPHVPVNALMSIRDLPPVYHWLNNTSTTVTFYSKEIHGG